MEFVFDWVTLMGEFILAAFWYVVEVCRRAAIGARDQIAAWKPVVDPFIWFFGSLLAIIPGSFAIHKWLYYGRTRLPQRYEEMLRVEEKRLHDARTALRQQIERPESITPFKAPIFLEPALKDALASLRWFRLWQRKDLGTADRKLEVAIGEIRNRLEEWENHRAHQLRQKAAAHLLRGAIAAANAEKARKRGEDSDQHSRDALSHFLAAVAVHDADVEALEYAAHQHRLLGEIDEAIALYARMTEHASGPEPEMALSRMRALRYHGEMLERKYDATNKKTHLDAGKALLETALKNMPQAAKGELLEAFTRRWLGSTEDKRNTATLWSAEYDKAERIFLDLIRRGRHRQEAEAGLAEVVRLREAAIARRAAGPGPDIDPTPTGSPPPV